MEDMMAMRIREGPYICICNDRSKGQEHSHRYMLMHTRACVLEDTRHAVAGWMSGTHCKNMRHSSYFSASNFRSAELRAAVGGCSVVWLLRC